MENFFKTTIAKLGGITPKKEQEIVGNNDKAMKKIMNDSDLKKVYDHWEGLKKRTVFHILNGVFLLWLLPLF